MWEISIGESIIVRTCIQYDLQVKHSCSLHKKHELASILERIFKESSPFKTQHEDIEVFFLFVHIYFNVEIGET